MRTPFLPLGLAALLLCPFPPAWGADAAPASTATPSPALTLEAAQALAAERSPHLAAAARELQAADGAHLQAGARRNPEFNASVEDARRDTRTTTATLGLPLELGGKRAARLAAAEQGQALARAELDSLRAQLRADVARAFFGLLVAQERTALAAGSAELAARGAAAVARRVAAGKVSPVDETRARVDEANARIEADEARAALATARQALAALWGDEVPGFAEARGDVESLPQRDAGPALLGTLDTAPALAAGRVEIERRRALVALERTRRTPDLTVSVGARRDNELGRTQAVVGLSIPLPLFDRNQGAIREAAARLDKADDEYRALRAQLAAELQQAATQLASARTTAQALKTTVLPAARQAHEAASRGFEAGKFGFLDVIDAQRALLQARTRYLAALAAAHQAAAAIDRVLGH